MLKKHIIVQFAPALTINESQINILLTAIRHVIKDI